jgi:hypothetical protein
MAPVKQAAVPNPLDGLKRAADAAKSAVSLPAPQKVCCCSKGRTRSGHHLNTNVLRPETRFYNATSAQLAIQPAAAQPAVPPVLQTQTKSYSHTWVHCNSAAVAAELWLLMSPPAGRASEPAGQDEAVCRCGQVGGAECGR